jgi:hypothetical protein
MFRLIKVSNKLIVHEEGQKQLFTQIYIIAEDALDNDYLKTT